MTETPNAAAAGSENKPPATPAAQAQPVAQPAIAVAVAGAGGAAVVLANPVEAPTNKPAGAENQKPDTAGQPDMPGSAIASGCIDFVLSPEDVAQEIAGIVRGETLLKQSDI